MSGNRLNEALDIANRIDDILDENLEYAFSEEIGYLTECPSNLGTGLRASLMLHLPMIEKSKSIGAISATLSKLGLTIRGTYGEGSEVVGSFYQLSNQITLGISERSAVDNLSAIADQIIAQEQQLRDVFDRTALEDKAYRAVGVLTHARILSSSELTEAASALLLGISAGILTEFSAESVRVLLGLIGPATIMSMVKKDLPSIERDVVRANLTREYLVSS
jgi:protein arginine kinase